MGRWTGAAVLIAVLALAGCTSRHRVPLEAKGCADECATTRSSCLAACAKGTGRAEVLENVRESLCGKRCGEDYERCVLACPGVE